MHVEHSRPPDTTPAAMEYAPMDSDIMRPPSPGSDSDDAYNTSTAKVYFGPLMSPEKKFAQILDPQTPQVTHNSKSISPRLHATETLLDTPEDLVEDVEDIQSNAEEPEESEDEPDPVQGGDEMPMLTILQQDEPSSALASRIMRAHDNPSPPPGSVRRRSGSLEVSPPPLCEDMEPKSTFVPTSPTSLLADTVTVDSNMELDSISRSPTPTAAFGTTKKRRSDLISFDSPVKDQLQSATIIAAPTPHIPTTSTIDELLFDITPDTTDSRAVVEAVVDNDDENTGSIFQISEFGGPARRRSARLSALPRQNLSELNGGGSPTRQLISLTPTPSPVRKRTRDSPTKSLCSQGVHLGVQSGSSIFPGVNNTTPRRSGEKREKKRQKLESTVSHIEETDSLLLNSTQILGSLAPPQTSNPELPNNVSNNPSLESTVATVDVKGKYAAEEQQPDNHQAQLPPNGGHQVMFDSSARPSTEDTDHQLSPVHSAPPLANGALGRNTPLRIPITPTHRTPGVHFSTFKLATPVFNRPSGKVDMSPQRVPSSRPQTSLFGGAFGNNKERETFTFVFSSTKTPERPRPAPHYSQPSFSSSIPHENKRNDKINKSRSGPGSSMSTVNQAHSESVDDPPSHKPLQFSLGEPSSSRALPSSSASVLPTSNPEVKSKIPRAGILAKSTSNLPQSRTSKLPMPKPRQTGKLVNNGLKISAIDKPTSRVSKPAVPKQRPVVQSAGPASTTASTSKRKISSNSRVKQTNSVPPSPGMTVMRQVLPGMFGNPSRPLATQSSSHLPMLSPSPIKFAGPIQARIIKDTVPGSFQAFDSLGIAPTQNKPLAQPEESSKDATNVAESNAQSSDTEEQPQIQPTDPVATSSAVPDISTLSMEEPKVRRSSRKQKTPQPETDVFGVVCSAPVGSARQRVARSKASSTFGTFYPPEGIALKTLTNNNTNRNQQYHATLEINTIRKPGNRPESPTIKLRTILEKQKEEQSRRRAERAKRRRADSSDSENEGSGAMDVDDSIVSGEGSPVSRRHMRGPGDEEDYETPERVTNATRKRVKWDRMLGTSIFLDEITVQGAQGRRDTEIVGPQKSCLIRDTERIQLDNLGNSLKANDPLDLDPETVVVTKYVYDNDEEAQVYIPPPPKVTRSKAKRK